MVSNFLKLERTHTYIEVGNFTCFYKNEMFWNLNFFKQIWGT